MMKKKWKISFNAPVVLIFAGLCFAATLLNYLTGGAANRYVFTTYRSSLINPLTYLRLFTHVIGHSGWAHFAGNMAYILLLGPMLEEKYSSQTLAGVMAITAVVTGLINAVFFPHVALCGASGVVFAFILLSSFTSFKAGEIPLTFILVAVFFIGEQVIQGLTVNDNISNMAHIVGGIIGGALGYGFNKKSKRR